MPRTVVLRAPAKLNLILRVGGRRPDGYHEVTTLLQSIALADRVTIAGRRGPFALKLTRAIGVPADRTNLVWRAAELLWRAAGRIGEARDALVTIDKEIPVAAGLGGGSADAAAALAGLNAVWQVGLSRAALMTLAADLGADVPFFLQGGTALGIGRGEVLFPVDDIPPMNVVVVKPAFGVATADAYGWLDADRAEACPASPAQPLDVGWPAGPIAIGNDLQAPAVRRHPEVEALVDACRREGALAAAMTGSGSAVFGLFRGAGASNARAAAKRLQRPDCLVFLSRTLSRREAVRGYPL